MIKRIILIVKKIISKFKSIIKKKISNFFRISFVVPKIISILKRKGIKNIEKFKVKSWHLNYMYFIGELEDKKVFIKYNKNSNWIEHEVTIIKYILKNSKAMSERLPQLYFYDINSKYNYIVEEFLDYKSVKTLILEKKIINKEKMLKEFVLIIKEMQKINLLHLDINSENVYLSEDGKVFIIDFGFSIIKDYIEFSFLNSNKRLKKLILLNLNSENRLDIGYIDDAFSFLEIAKNVDYELITKNYDYWIELNELTNKLYFDYWESKNEIE